MPQIGGTHYLYFAFEINDTVADVPTQDPGGIKEPTLHRINNILGLDGTPYNVTPTSIKTMNHADISSNFALHDIIRDVNVGGNQTTVDTTVREDVKQGFQTQLIAFSEGNMTFQTRYEPTDAAGLFLDETFLALMYSFTKKQTIFGVDLDKPKTQLGAMGLAGNWSVGFGNPKPVGGLVVIDWNLTLSSKPQYVINDTDTVHSFRALIDPHA